MEMSRVVGATDEPTLQALPEKTGTEMIAEPVDELDAETASEEAAPIHAEAARSPGRLFAPWEKEAAAKL